MFVPCRAAWAWAQQPPRGSSSSSGSSRRLTNRLPVCAAAGGSSSPWGSPPEKRRGGSSSGGGGQSKGKKQAGDGSKSKGSSKGGRDGAKSAAKKPKSGSSTSGQGFGPKAQVQPPVQTYKITPPLTPQLLDELSSWETAAAPLWGTFCGHCEGTWLGQYSAYTPWGGDPEPVWADESGAYLTHAFCRVSEERQSLPAGSADGADNTQQQPEQQQPADAGELLDLLVRTTQRSASIASLIGGVSATTAAAATAATTSSSPPSDAASASAAAAASSSDAAEDEDLEAVAYNTSGSVVFNGGSYSLGPDVIQVPQLAEAALDDYYAALEAAAAAGGLGAEEECEGEEEGDDPLSALPYSTVVVEQALVAAGDKRLRLVATLKVRRPPGQEMDIEIARLLLYKEYWYGTSDSTSTSSGSSSSSRRLQLLPSHSFEVPVTQLARPQPAGLAGTWNVFVMAANPAVEENPNTLQDETVVLYSSREERQHWHVPTVTSSAAPTAAARQPVAAAGVAEQQQQQQQHILAEGSSGEGGEDDDSSGGSWWLPGGALVSVRMVQPSSSAQGPGEGQEGGDASSNGSSSSSSGGQSSGSHRGLVVGLHMLDGPGSCLFVEREYDAEGGLVEVRHGTAVKGGWSGGRM